MSPAPEFDSPAPEVARGSAREREGERERWNRKYAERDVDALRRLPAQWLADNEDLLAGAPGRRALDIACGNGRNAGTTPTTRWIHGSCWGLRSSAAPAPARDRPLPRRHIRARQPPTSARQPRRTTPLSPLNRRAARLDAGTTQERPRPDLLSNTRAAGTRSTGPSPLLGRRCRSCLVAIARLRLFRS
jgi:hypothetical protein